MRDSDSRPYAYKASALATVLIRQNGPFLILIEGHITLGTKVHNFVRGQLASLVILLSFHGRSHKTLPRGIKFFNFSIYIISKIFIKIKFIFYTGSFIFLVISILAIVLPNKNVINFFLLTTAFGKLFTIVSAIIHW